MTEAHYQRPGPPADVTPPPGATYPSGSTNPPTPDSSDLAKFKCHKIVQAGKIVGIFARGSTHELIFAAPTRPKFMPLDWIERYKPLVGGYLVVYDDGYTSFSPAQAFEEGYAPLEPPYPGAGNPTAVDPSKTVPTESIPYGPDPDPPPKPDDSDAPDTHSGVAPHPAAPGNQ